MTKWTKKQYEVAQLKVEELLTSTEGVDDINHPDMILLEHYSNVVADYEEHHFPIDNPSLTEVIRLRMYEMGLKQSDLARLLEVPSSRMSEYLRGKREITLEVAKKLHKRLNIDSDIILQ
ncbi:MAG: helix-turn-helix domain-containing protein [Bacteroidota bacterium]